MGGYNITVDEPEKSYLLCFTKLELVEIFFNSAHAKELFDRRVYCLLNLHPVPLDVASDYEFFNNVLLLSPSAPSATWSSTRACC